MTRQREREKRLPFFLFDICCCNELPQWEQFVSHRICLRERGMNRDPIALTTTQTLSRSRSVDNPGNYYFLSNGVSRDRPRRGTLATTSSSMSKEEGEMRQIKSERRASFFSPHLRETLSSSSVLRAAVCHNVPWKDFLDWQESITFSSSLVPPASL